MSANTESGQLTRTYEFVGIPLPGIYELDPSHSHIGFMVRHLMVAKVRGRFGSFRGTIVIADDPLRSSVDVEIDVASIDTRDPARDNHLRSPDFFDAEQFPSMRYRSTGVSDDGRGRWRVDGELTIRDVTRKVDLEVEFDGVAVDPWEGVRIAFTASAQLDREDFGLTWNQPIASGGVLSAARSTSRSRLRRSGARRADDT